MNKKLIQDLAITDGIYDCICDPYDKLKNGDPYSSVMVDLERFAEKIVSECIAMCKTAVGNADYNTGRLHCLENIKERFGIE
jgi:hypothetical protein